MLRSARLVGTSQLRRFSSSFDAAKYSDQNDETVISERFKTVTILRLNRPHKQNAFNRTMLERLADELHKFEQDDSTRVAVIHGMGGNFSSGYDLDELKAVAKDSPHDLEKSLILPYRRRTIKPLLCGVSGVCKSIGLEIALMCDQRTLEDSAKLSLTHRDLGIPHLADGPRRLAELVGRQTAFQLLTTAQELSSSEARAMGITDRDVVEDGTVVGGILKFAIQISSLSPLALEYDLNTLNDVANDNNDRWQGILEVVRQNVQLDSQTLKAQRIFKLNNMAAWEQDEFEREQKNSAETLQQA